MDSDHSLTITHILLQLDLLILIHHLLLHPLHLIHSLRHHIIHIHVADHRERQLRRRIRGAIERAERRSIQPGDRVRRTERVPPIWAKPKP